jgi:hypothetical protein
MKVYFLRKFYYRYQSVPFLGSCLRLGWTYLKILRFRFSPFGLHERFKKFDSALIRYAEGLEQKYSTPKIDPKMEWPPSAD